MASKRPSGSAPSSTPPSRSIPTLAPPGRRPRRQGRVKDEGMTHHDVFRFLFARDTTAPITRSCCGIYRGFPVPTHPRILATPSVSVNFHQYRPIFSTSTLWLFSLSSLFSRPIDCRHDYVGWIYIASNQSICQKHGERDRLGSRSTFFLSPSKYSEYDTHARPRTRTHARTHAARTHARDVIRRGAPRRAVRRRA